jgi:hypothetical protein
MIGNSLTSDRGWRRRRRGGAVAASLLLACAALTGSAGPASAADYEYWPQDVHTGLCLDDSSVGLRGYSCNGLDYQNWYATDNYDGSFVLQNVQTGLCLDDSFHSGLRGYPCNGLDYQWWNIFLVG